MLNSNGAPGRTALISVSLLLLLLPLKQLGAAARTHSHAQAPGSDAGKHPVEVNRDQGTASYLQALDEGAGALAGRLAVLLGAEEPLRSDDLAALTRQLR